MANDFSKNGPPVSDDCLSLGHVRIGGRAAELYACEDLLIACFSEPRGGFQAQHMYKLTFESDVFLLAAFRLYLDRVGKVPMPNVQTGDDSLEC